MQANAKREITILIALSEKEAIWLKDYVQNFLKSSERPTSAACRLDGACYAPL